MLGIHLKHSIAAVAATALAVGVVAYNGHAGLGASVYQHNQTDLEFLAGVTDGTSNTVLFGERAAKPAAAGLAAKSILMADMGGQLR